MNFDKIKQEISISSYLRSIGYKPKTSNAYSERYLAPYREEKEPSLVVNTNTNLWFDHGLGKGGNIIQLASLINNCDLYEASKILISKQHSFSFHRKIIESRNTIIQIDKIKKLENKALLEYLISRKINLKIAQFYCQEIYYSINNKKYFAIGFQNNIGGYELRNKYFKGCTKKDITTIISESKTLLVFEGFIDFLSYKTDQLIHKNESVLILNSLSLSQKAETLFENFEVVNLYLDNYNSGQSVTEKWKSAYQNVKDYSTFYVGYKDYNKWLSRR